MTTLDISMLEFLKTGAFGPVALGMTRQQVQNLLGEPPSWSITRRRKRLQIASVWRYGSIELYFRDWTDILHMIFSDHFPLEGCATIDLDSWILEEWLPLPDATMLLDSVHVKYQQTAEKLTGYTILTLESGVTLRFYPPDDNLPGANSLPGLTAVCLASAAVATNSSAPYAP